MNFTLQSPVAATLFDLTEAEDQQVTWHRRQAHETRIDGWQYDHRTMIIPVQAARRHMGMSELSGP